jgi:hypothetical protein
MAGIEAIGNMGRNTGNTTTTTTIGMINDYLSAPASLA